MCSNSNATTQQLCDTTTITTTITQHEQTTESESLFDTNFNLGLIFGGSGVAGVVLLALIIFVIVKTCNKHRRHAKKSDDGVNDNVQVELSNDIVQVELSNDIVQVDASPFENAVEPSCSYQPKEALTYYSTPSDTNIPSVGPYEEVSFAESLDELDDCSNPPFAVEKSCENDRLVVRPKQAHPPANYTLVKKDEKPSKAKVDNEIDQEDSCLELNAVADVHDCETGGFYDNLNADAAGVVDQVSSNGYYSFLERN